MFTCLFTFLAPGLLLTGLVLALLVPVAVACVILASILFWLVTLRWIGQVLVWAWPLKQGRS